MMDKFKTDASYGFYKNILDNLYDGIYFVDCGRRITYWNNGAERISGYKSSEVVGRHCWDNILMHVDEKGVSLCRELCQLSETIMDGHMREREVYLLHKDGHRVPVLMRTVVIRDQAGKTIGAVEIFNDNISKLAYAQKLQELQKMAMFDHLTGLPNRRYIEMALNTRLSEMQRYGWIHGVLFIDIDNFKNVNDRYGHHVGDDILNIVASTLLNNSRPFDTVGRWGGEEFVAIILNAGRQRLYSIAERFRVLVEKANLSLGAETISVTVSVGATLAQKNDTVDTLLKRADRLMYQSKLAGRNKVSMKLEAPAAFQKA